MTTRWAYPSMMLSLALIPTVSAADDNPPKVTSPDKRWVATSEGNAVHLVEAATGKLLFKTVAHTRKVTALAFSPDAKALVSAGEDKTIRILDVPTGRELIRIDKAPPGLTGLTVSVDGQTVTALDKESKALAQWELATGKEVPLKKE